MNLKEEIQAHLGSFDGVPVPDGKPHRINGGWYCYDGVECCYGSLRRGSTGVWHGPSKRGWGGMQ